MKILNNHKECKKVFEFTFKEKLKILFTGKIKYSLHKANDIFISGGKVNE